MARVVLSDVGKLFGRTVAVHDVNLEIEDGEFVVLVGPSGCGKSTTLRMIAGLEEATSGTIQFDGAVVTDVSPAERNVAMVFQSYALYPHMSVAENMGFALRQRGIARKQVMETVRQTAELLGVAELLDRRPRALSGGQRQRVAMGRAIVRRPSVFLFDEPLSNLDAALRAQMRIEIKKLHQLLRTTVIYVTHDQIEAMTLADRIVVMSGGEVAQVGPPLDVYNQPRTKFVAGFIGAPRMNFVPCRIVVRGDGTLELDVHGDERWPVPPGQTKRFSAFVDRPMELGIRPEHVREGHRGGPDAVDLRVTPSVVEPTGADTLVVFPVGGVGGLGGVGGVDVAARCAPHGDIAVGKPMELSIDFTRVHVIDPESGLVVPPVS
jgi:multiple sugar transport system ATP-binding protein